MIWRTRCPQGWAIHCLYCWKLRLRYWPSRIATSPRRHG